jgi:hypothetical protein
MISIETLRQKFGALFRFLFDDHGIEWECRRCNERLRFTHRAEDVTIEAELDGHQCKAEVAA